MKTIQTLIGTGLITLSLLAASCEYPDDECIKEPAMCGWAPPVIDCDALPEPIVCVEGYYDYACPDCLPLHDADGVLRLPQPGDPLHDEATATVNEAVAWCIVELGRCGSTWPQRFIPTDTPAQL